jgi:hypothetical protein
MASKTAKGLLTTIALSMMGGATSAVSSAEALIIICPEHAAILAAGGYTKRDIRQELFLRARVPHEKFSEDNLELLAKRRPRWFQRSELREIPIVDRPEDLWIVVAGGKGAKSVFIPGRTSTHMLTNVIQDGSQLTGSVDCLC